MKVSAVPQGVIAEKGRHQGGTQRRTESWFYIGFALFMILLSIIGFGPSIIDQANRNAPPTVLVMLHGLAVVLLLLLFLTQVILVATGRTVVHQRIGKLGLVVVPLMIVVSYLALIDFGRRGHDLSGDVIRALSRTGSRPFDSAGLVFPLGELLAFGAVFTAGLLYRRRPQIHKRLMTLAMVPILTEPILHFVGQLAGHWPRLQGMGPAFSIPGSLLLLTVPAVFDLLSQRRVHPVSLWVPVLLFTWQLALSFLILPSDVWRKFAAWLVS
jgi:hypothetical protein